MKCASRMDEWRLIKTHQYTQNAKNSCMAEKRKFRTRNAPPQKKNLQKNKLKQTNKQANEQNSNPCKKKKKKKTTTKNKN